MSENWKNDTLAAQALGHVDRETGAVVPPVHLATTYVRDARSPDPASPLYARTDNPTFAPAEALLARLENGADALVFSSGMSAATAVVMALAPGAHIVAPGVMYWAFRNWLVDWCKKHGLELSLVDATDPNAIDVAVIPGKTKLIWLETPGNPLWTVSDIAACAVIARNAGAKLAVDSTVATPVHTRPLDLGADIVMHSASKYLNGHSDVIAGALACREQDDFWAAIKQIRAQLGTILGPQEASLLLRGMRTLPLRVKRQSENALNLAYRLEDHPAVSEVLYPGLESDPGYITACKQMKDGFGGMLSIRLKDGMEAAIRVTERTKLWKRATSLGGVESLIEHRYSIEGPDSPVPDDLLRLSVGIEDCWDLLADLEQAFPG
ncbi:trans-sulfuration enzyme family protein [Aestuariispira insulae]|uniref:Cystathionine gamma-synthase n=1 Tax=Aestuariispira insulae TaxID=1461337 RepID=A0A3D9HSD7_9PROT|nr:aminotransferase class I/II-fold pyridoxal phosphate-dependent enzyme [Aestuariispira insulae]RED52412.1 cystathionine gamma-synthase [Aestuariispira insulae]